MIRGLSVKADVKSAELSEKDGSEDLKADVTKDAAGDISDNRNDDLIHQIEDHTSKIGRASCRERV